MNVAARELGRRLGKASQAAQPFDEDEFIRRVIFQAEFGHKPVPWQTPAGLEVVKTPFQHTDPVTKAVRFQNTILGYPIYKKPGEIHAYTKPEHWLPMVRGQFRRYREWPGVKTLGDALKTWAKDWQPHARLVEQHYGKGMLERPIGELFKPYQGRQ